MNFLKTNMLQVSSCDHLHNFIHKVVSDRRLAKPVDLGDDQHRRGEHRLVEGGAVDKEVAECEEVEGDGCQRVDAEGDQTTLGPS